MGLREAVELPIEVPGRACRVLHLKSRVNDNLLQEVSGSVYVAAAGSLKTLRLNFRADEPSGDPPR